jgi:hypothetical protein
VGTFGSSGERFPLVMASAFSLPAWICGRTALMFWNEAFA